MSQDTRNAADRNATAAATSERAITASAPAVITARISKSSRAPIPEAFPRDATVKREEEAS